MIFEQVFEKEIKKCVHIALLCVQEAANDRPSVATMCSMLSSEIVDIPEPKQPAFITRNVVASEEAGSSENSEPKASINNVTITDVSKHMFIKETLYGWPEIHHSIFIDG